MGDGASCRLRQLLNFRGGSRPRGVSPDCTRDTHRSAVGTAAPRADSGMIERHLPVEGEPFNPFGLLLSVNVPDAVLANSQLSPGAKLTYGVLLRFVGKDGHCYPSQETISKRLAVTVRQVAVYCEPRTGVPHPRYRSWSRLRVRVSLAGRFPGFHADRSVLR